MTSTQAVDPRLRAAVDASLAWYDAMCALHGVRCGFEDDTWVAYDQPPPLHSNAKTAEPGAGSERALAALEPFEHGGIADSFGRLDLARAGLDLLFEARWLHLPAPARPARSLPPGWDPVGSPDDLAVWTGRHDTTDVLLPALLDRSAFTVLARHDQQQGLVGGAVAHLCTGVVDVTNVWSDDDTRDRHWHELVAAVAALHPGRALVGYEHGADLDAALDAGFTDVGPQRVWVR